MLQANATWKAHKQGHRDCQDKKALLFIKSGINASEKQSCGTNRQTQKFADFNIKTNYFFSDLEFRKFDLDLHALLIWIWFANFADSISDMKKKTNQLLVLSGFET